MVIFLSFSIVGVEIYQMLKKEKVCKNVIVNRMLRLKKKRKLIIPISPPVKSAKRVVRSEESIYFRKLLAALLNSCDVFL